MATLRAWGATAGTCDGAPVTREFTFDWPATATLSWVIGEPTDGG